MVEIMNHGCGGQESVVASKIVAVAAFREGNDIQSFHYFGVERTGAPVTAFTRIDSRTIPPRSQISEPDYVVILEPSMVGVVDMIREAAEVASQAAYVEMSTQIWWGVE